MTEQAKWLWGVMILLFESASLALVLRYLSGLEQKEGDLPESEPLRKVSKELKGLEHLRIIFKRMLESEREGVLKETNPKKRKKHEQHVKHTEDKIGEIVKKTCRLEEDLLDLQQSEKQRQEEKELDSKIFSRTNRPSEP